MHECTHVLTSRPPSCRRCSSPGPAMATRAEQPPHRCSTQDRQSPGARPAKAHPRTAARSISLRVKRSPDAAPVIAWGRRPLVSSTTVGALARRPRANGTPASTGAREWPVPATPGAATASSASVVAASGGSRTRATAPRGRARPWEPPNAGPRLAAVGPESLPPAHRMQGRRPTVGTVAPTMVAPSAPATVAPSGPATGRIPCVPSPSVTSARARAAPLGRSARW